MKKFLNILWQRWKRIALFIGKVQTAIILSLIYYLIITPIGILTQILKLLTRQTPSSYWLKRKKGPTCLADFYKQY